ncbi:MAG: lytic transglycosylase domain-containing protein [Nitrosomonadales bacterium]|nr:lytic transglycosylase domain-containing protein [Nitrosomonadales bacterium]
MRFILLSLLIFPAFAYANEDADFLAARDAFRAGNAVKLERLSEHLVRSPLEPYVTYYRLRMNLEGGDPSPIQAFLSRPEDTPMIDRLRGEWLKLLGRRQQWETFEAEYPRLKNEGAELSCYALQARYRKQSEEALAEARKLWLVGREQPESCAPLFLDAINRNIITEQDIWSRLRLALESGSVTLAKRLATQLPASRAVSPVALDSAASSPERYLDQAQFEHESQRLVALFALQRLAKQTPLLAYNHWQRISGSFPEAEQRYFFGWLGYEAARKLDARALEWYQVAGDAPLSEAQLEWRARAALRVQDWAELGNSISRMSPPQQRISAWRYWQARALKAQGKSAEAEKQLAALATEYSFYGQLAAEELGSTPTVGVTQANFKPSKVELAKVESLPGVQRALMLYRLEMRSEAAKEWSWATRQFDDRQLLTAAEVARRNEMYDRAINAADRTVAVHDFSLRYLSPYRDELQGHLRENGLEEAWVYGLMRQESRFVTQAKSGVGAAGLMQIMPATARWVAKKLGLKSYKESLIHQMETNMKLGTYYMKTVLGWFDGNPVLASAAYNAGPGRARRWRGDTPLEGAIYAETIPFDETRDYVKKVMSNTTYYAALFGQPGPSLKQRMGIIEARSTTNQAPIPDEK